MRKYNEKTNTLNREPGLILGLLMAIGVGLVWPGCVTEIGREELYEALKAYSQRDRRFGGIQDDYGSPHEQAEGAGPREA